jgi:hypothetical protein
MSAGGAITLDYHQIVLLPSSYVIGIVPALVVAVFDYAIGNVLYRILWTALFAFGAAFIPLIGALMMGFIHSPYILLFGIIGAVPGAICSWLAGKVNKIGVQDERTGS